MVARRWLLLTLLGVGGSAGAEPPSAAELPSVLRDWTSWVLHDAGSEQCPFLHGQELRVCAWPGRLQLTLDERGGRLNQAVKMSREGWFGLPGDARQWPQGVRVNGQPAVVVPVSGEGPERPSVRLGLGEHTVTGEFFWDSMPEALVIPPATGLLNLTVRGQPIAEPHRDAEGRVYLQKASAEQEAERVDITVHRLVTDEIPLTLITRLVLNVSGRSRELVLGRALPDAFVPTVISSGLPLRIEPDGRLRLQVRPGHWVVELTARHDGLVSQLSRPSVEGPWAEGDEVWAFDARPSLRQVLVEGVVSVDARQTTLPAEWARFPAYAMGEKDTMSLTERRRGDQDPAPDTLHLQRTLWLDFNGGGFTVSDRIGGQLHRSWRLEMQPPTVLGRVVASGADQPITRLDGGLLTGVELRQGQLALEADSRIEGHRGDLPAISWDADFHSVAATLQLPPGWTVLHASGPDEVPGTWVSRWTLLDLFLVLIIALAMGRLFGPLFGGLALLTLALSWHEGDLVPRYCWLAVLVGEALWRVLPDSAVRTLMRVYRFGAWAFLVLFTVAFMVEHVRLGMYPALAMERSLGGVKSWADYSTENALQYTRSSKSGGDQLESRARQEEPTGEPQEQSVDLGALDALETPASPPVQAPLPRSGKRSFNVLDYDKNATVQTGPGLPRWEWHAVALRFSGPVSRTQRLSLWLMGPTANFIASLVRAALVALLVLVVIGLPGGAWPPFLKRRLRWGAPGPSSPAERNRATPVTRARWAGGLGLLLAAVLLPSSVRAQGGVPDQETLEILKRRLLEKPDCAPTCASNPRLALEATPRVLRLRLEVLAAAETAVPLPGHAQHWVPETVVLDGRPTSGLRRDDRGTLWLVVSPGAHQVLVEGALPARETVQIALPLRPRRTEVTLEGWSIDGLHEDGLADDNVQLSRTAKNNTGETSALQTGTLPPFVRVERRIVLGLEWTVETTASRLTPTGAAVVLEVPLLDGESMTSGEIRVQARRALVNMGASVNEVSWSSVLDAQSPIALTAPRQVPWVEVWRLDVSPVWHVRFSGIPVVHQQDSAGVRLPEWRPWPGEVVQIDVIKPDGVPGQTLTIDQSSLVVRPGVRATDVTFTANLRSSRGGVHPLELPESAELQSVSLNGQQQPIRQEGRAVAIPLVPGSMNLAMSWRQAGGLTTAWRTPRVNTGGPTVNAELQVSLPNDRWVLFLWGGPRMGPAVLFWSFLLVLLAVSAALGRIRWTPLKTRHWVLLALGLSQVPIPAIATVFGWLLLLGWRHRRDLSPGWFNLRQLGVVAATVVALVVVVMSVYEGLLGRPSMQVTGNASSAWELRWFEDRTETLLPTATVVSVPMIVYRAAMLLWSLWMALAMLKWLKWGWQSFSSFGLWKRVPPPPPRAKAPPPATG